MRARRTLGKFVFVPVEDVNEPRDIGAGPRYLTVDWRQRQQSGALVFEMRWIAFLDEARTPVETLTRPWAQDHSVKVGTVTFPRLDPICGSTNVLIRIRNQAN